MFIMCVSEANPSKLRWNMGKKDWSTINFWHHRFYNWPLIISSWLCHIPLVPIYSKYTPITSPYVGWQYPIVCPSPYVPILSSLSPSTFQKNTITIVTATFMMMMIIIIITTPTMHPIYGHPQLIHQPSPGRRAWLWSQWQAHQDPCSQQWGRPKLARSDRSVMGIGTLRWSMDVYSSKYGDYRLKHPSPYNQPKYTT